MENFADWPSPTLDIRHRVADSHKTHVIEHDYFHIQQVPGFCSAEGCMEVNYSKFVDHQQVHRLNLEELQSENISCSPKLFSVESDVNIPSATSCNNVDCSLKLSDYYYCPNPINDDNIRSLNIDMNNFNNVSLSNVSNMKNDKQREVTINKENLQLQNVESLNFNKFFQEKIVPSKLNKTPGAIISKCDQSVSRLMPTVDFSNTFENPDKIFHDRGVFKPNRYLLPTFPLVPYSARNFSKKITVEKYTKRVPVSIKARNAKFLCSEKDLRKCTVRELLKTCDTIQENILNKELFSDRRIVTQSKLTSNCNHLNTQNSFPIPLNLSDNSKFSEDSLYKENENHLFETNNESLFSKINTIDPILMNILPIDDTFPNSKNNPESLPPVQNIEGPGFISSVPMKVYQPTSDYQKFVKVKNLCENKIPRPKHFDFSFLQIRNFKYFCTDSNFKRTSKLKVIFSKKKLVYEFQVGKMAESFEGCTKYFAIIEVDFNTIVAMWGQKDKFRLQVKVPPHMYVGSCFYNKNQNGSTKNIKYDRSHYTDLTCGELYQIPFHYIQLRSMSVNNLLASLSQFSPHFELMLQCPFIETFCKPLPQPRPVTSNFIIDIPNEAFSTCQNTQNQNIEFFENISECSHHMDSPKINCNMCFTMDKSF